MAAVDHRFRVMASGAQVLVVDGPPDASAWAEARLRELEARWSRFRPHSDISRMNCFPDTPVPVSADTIVLLDTLVEGWHLTAGRFDPSMLPDLLTAGYRASIDDPDAVTVLPVDARSGADLDRIEIDREAGTVVLGAGAAIDPGGLGKGLAADIVADELLADGAAGALVSIGGDLAVRGRAPDDAGWTIGVEHPDRPGEILYDLRIDGGGVATSSTRSRRWEADGVERHHVVDPVSGLPAETDVAAVTVVAPAAWRAEVLATAALIGGAEDAPRYLEGQGVHGLVVDREGHVGATFDLPNLEVA